MSNEKIYMPVEETDRMYKEENVFYLYNEMLYDDVNSLVKKYSDKKLIPITDKKSVGVMSVPNNGIKRVFHKFNYVVYSVNDNKEFLINSSQLKFKDALLFARTICKQNVCECFIVNGQKKIVPVNSGDDIRDEYFKAYYDVIEKSGDKVVGELSHSDYVKAYSSMKKFTDDEPEKPTKIRYRHR